MTFKEQKPANHFMILLFNKKIYNYYNNKYEKTNK